MADKMWQTSSDGEPNRRGEAPLPEILVGAPRAREVGDRRGNALLDRLSWPVPTTPNFLHHPQQVSLVWSGQVGRSWSGLGWLRGAAPLHRILLQPREDVGTLEALGNLGEFVGAVGVVVSLVYLGLQLRQNTSSVRASSFNSMIQNSIRLLEHTFADSEFAALLARAERDPADLSLEERVRWDAYMTAVFRHFGNLVYQNRVGALDAQMWESYRQDLKEHLRSPHWAAWFRERQVVFSESLVEEVALLVEEIRSEGALTTPAAAPTVGRPRELPRSLHEKGQPG